MKVVTASEMREIDRRAIEEFGVPSLDLMERAGAGSAEVIAKSGLETGAEVVVLCGRGNNGGDGFVTGRYLKEWGAHVTCWMIGERDELTKDTLRNLVAAEESGVVIRPYRPGASDEQLSEDLSDAKCAVDALLGTGSKGKLRKPVRELTRVLNGSGARVFALDVPTGMNADSGAVDPDCVRAAMTITFGFPKRGMYSLPGRDHCGDITVVDLGYPEESVDVSTGVLLWDEMRQLMPLRDPRGHKGTFGQVVVLAGSPGLSGAACLAAESAMRSGAGSVKLFVPESVWGVCAAKLTEVMVFPVPQSASGTFAPESIAAVRRELDQADSVLLGPGLSLREPAVEFVREVLPRIERPLVLDADGLNALAGYTGPAAARLAALPAVLTPHPGELARLLGKKPRDLVSDSVVAARTAAERFGCEIIFKSAPAVVASPDGTIDLCSLGNDGMATAGSGDVLAGLVAGLFAQGYEAAAAARVGTMVHARAGDICRAELGRRGMIAGDMIRCLPYAWRELEEDPPRARPERAEPEEEGE
jgi:NAD(P)H-hydrate epimerase